jgi:hypothetical protein
MTQQSLLNQEKSEVQNFTAILHRFGLATGLRANIEKNTSGGHQM